MDEFKPLGWDDAKPGGTFIKIGVGTLRKSDDAAYDNYRLYDIVDGGKWDIKKNSDSVEFVQTLTDASSGYGYVYRKIVQLTSGKPELTLRHSIKNTSMRVIQTSVYNHNFLVLDQKPPAPGVSITVPFQIHSPNPPPTGSGIAPLCIGKEAFESPYRRVGFSFCPVASKINCVMASGCEINDK